MHQTFDEIQNVNKLLTSTKNVQSCCDD